MLFNFVLILVACYLLFHKGMWLDVVSFLRGAFGFFFWLLSIIFAPLKWLARIEDRNKQRIEEKRALKTEEENRQDDRFAIAFLIGFFAFMGFMLFYLNNSHPHHQISEQTRQEYYSRPQTYPEIPSNIRQQIRQQEQR